MYDSFAEYYDLLTSDVDYPARTDYILQLFEHFDRKPTLMLDLACGTGAFSCLLAKSGISVIGVDISPDMLSRAEENAAKDELDILFLCQSAAELDLYGTVDGAVCCLDSLNHITDYEELCRAIGRVSLFLESNRLFIFDVNTVYKHETVLGDNTFVSEEDGIYCVWQNEYEPTIRTTYMSLDFFAGDGVNYVRESQFVDERAYTDTEIRTALQNANMMVEAVFGDLSLESPAPDAERVIYVARKNSKKV